ncbi:MAG: hypothetical protein O3A13_13265 [Proteobacteria bacterium]|nr:hypothetical protein [Pseudomonadota bacterium]MDA0994582.1 hypothetical protein [Pseudomonadota bacterium]
MKKKRYVEEQIIETLSPFAVVNHFDAIDDIAAATRVTGTLP